MRALLQDRLAVPRASWWTWTALRTLRRDLPSLGLASSVVPPRTAAWTGRGGVEAVLDHSSATCLEKSMLRQMWLASFGRHHDVLVGVSTRAGLFEAHAWLAGLPDVEDTTRFTVLARRASNGLIEGPQDVSSLTSESAR